MSTELSIETRIDRVTLFRNGALVVRVADLPEDTSFPASILIPGLPLLFRQDTLRVRLLAPGGEDPGLRMGPLQEEAILGHAPERKGPDKMAIRAVTRAVARLQADRTAWEARLRWYEEIRLPTSLDLPRRAPPTHPDLGAWSSLAGFASAGRERCAAELESLRIRIRDLDEEMERLQRQEQADHPTGESEPARYTRTLRVGLERTEAPEQSRVRLEVEYFMGGARWAPSYDLYVHSADNTVELVLQAHMAQATGEDWHGVAVSVSTADLHRETRLPDQASWRIGRAAPPPPPAWRPLPEDTDTLFADYDAVPCTAAPKHAVPRSAPVTPPFQMAAPGSMAPGPMAPPPPGMAGDDEMTRGPAKMKKGRQAGRMREEGASMDMAACVAPQCASPVSASAPPPARRSIGGLVAGGFAAMAPEAFAAKAAMEEPEPEMGPPPPLDPGLLLDYAWLRLSPWDQVGRRGRLLPVDLCSDLRALVEERGGDPDRYQELERAMETLRKRQRRLATLPLPEGCVDLQKSSFFFRYPAGPRVDLPGDGRFHQGAVARGRKSCATVFRVVPRQDPTAFRFAVAENPLAMPLPEGPVRVCLDGAYLATGRIESTGAAGTLHLGLGVEDRVRVARNVTFTESEKGVIGTQAVGVHRVRTKLRCMLPGRAHIQILERLPLSEGLADVSVDLDQATPAPTRDQGPDGRLLKGALQWDLHLDAETPEVEIAWQYTIKLPAKKELVGGNRREP